MARYTEKLTATIKYWYEETDRPIDAIANDFDVCSRNIQRMAATENWSRRRDRKRKPRDVPAANLLLAEAMGLALVSPPPERGRSDCAAVRVGVSDKTSLEEETPTLTLPLAGGGNPSTAADGNPNAPSSSAAERLEALVLKQIEAVEQGGTARPGRRQAAGAADRRARTLSTLTQTLHALQRLRAGSERKTFNADYDDMPRDIDEFRRALARRIDAFVASRTDGGDAGGHAGLKPLADAG